jgi:hypothetical protein
MTEEIKEEAPQSKKEERTLSVLEQVKAERAAFEAAKEESRNILDELKEFRANEILSGKSDAGKKEDEKPKEETPQEYSQRILQGKLEKE